MTIRFDTVRHYVDFVGAREFLNSRDGTAFRYQANACEGVGRVLSRPVLGISNKALQNINDPLMIIALTIVALVTVSIWFYPAAALQIVGTVFPFALKLTPGMVRMASFLTVELTILGIGLKAIGRMCNHALVDAWNANQLVPVPIGAVIRKV